ncbi:MAG TPA: phenylalanine--tRNA ligase subunit beta, partial [bacterium]|nr:phenylalanine--tRNA ligase subunit beta [bacterium]
MRYSFKTLSQYISGNWSETEVENRLQMLGLNPVFVKEGGDTFIELEVPSNRGDLLSALGIVNALAPFMDIEPKYPDVNVEEQSKKTFQVEIMNPEDCFLYAGRVIESVSVGPSPVWLEEKVNSAGFRSVNNVVDITNLVFWEYGQPLHAFDMDHLKQKIVVRRAKKDEEIITLDGVKRHLGNDVLAICDVEKVVAIAGIMGGLNSQVEYTTKNLFIESAFFNPTRIRRGAKYLGMSTDASARFEKGVTGSLVIPALDRCCYLINQMCGGKTSLLCTAGAIPSERKSIQVSMGKISTYLGCEIPKPFIINILQKLGCCVKIDEDLLEIDVPDSRNDLELDVDIIEEIAKYWGYEKIPEDMPLVLISPSVSSQEYSRLDALKDVFIKLGFNEVINLGLDDGEFRYDDCQDNAIEILNPLSMNYAFLRCSMIPGLLQNIEENCNRKIESLSIFEIGNIYIKKESQFSEVPFVGLATMNKGNLYSFKGNVDYILKKIGCNITSQNISKQKIGTSIEFLQNTDKRGRIFLPSRDLLKRYNIEQYDIFLAEIALDNFVKTGFIEKRYKAPSKTMPIKRDLSLLVPNSVNWQDVEEMLARKIPFLEDIKIFDIYRGKNIPKDVTAVAVALRFSNPDGNLTRQVIEDTLKNIIEEMKKNFAPENFNFNFNF